MTPLRWIAVLAVAGLLGCAPEVPRVSAPVESVIVVGAGVSGLAAARSLHLAGIPVTTLEAHDRIGGRTSTVLVAGARVDEGAAWVHGVVDNPLSHYMDARGLDYRPHPYDFALGWDEGVGPISVPELRRIEDRFIDMVRYKDDLESALGRDASVADGIDRFVENEGQDDQTARRMRAIFRAATEINAGGPAEAMSLAHFFEESGHAGGDHLPVGGYVGLVDALADGLDIRLQSAVVSIAYGETGVRVQVSSGEVFSGSQVIVTVPLGVLKAGAIAFEPALPEEKLQAISRLDMGNLEKVVLVFDEAFWLDAFERDVLVYVSQTEGANPSFFDVTEDALAPTLVSLYAGGYARAVQSLEPEVADAMLVGDALASLSEALQRSVPRPVATHVTHWTRDPLSLGSYSFIPVGSSPADYDRLAAPVDDRVLFAGEATYYPYLGTVTGAFLSGLREAKRLGGAALEGL